MFTSVCGWWNTCRLYLLTSVSSTSVMTSGDLTWSHQHKPHSWEHVLFWLTRTMICSLASLRSTAFLSKPTSSLTPWDIMKEERTEETISETLEFSNLLDCPSLECTSGVFFFFFKSWSAAKRNKQGRKHLVPREWPPGTAYFSFSMRALSSPDTVCPAAHKGTP